MNNKDYKQNYPRKLNTNDLFTFFSSHLNYIYCAKEHLIKLLPLLKDVAVFSGLKHAIDETRLEIEVQLKRLDKIYTLLDSKPSKDACKSIKEFLSNTVNGINNDESKLPELRDMSILFYLQNLEGLMMASCQALRIAGFKMNIPQIRSLLKENYVEAKRNSGPIDVNLVEVHLQ